MHEKNKDIQVLNKYQIWQLFLKFNNKDEIVSQLQHEEYNDCFRCNGCSGCSGPGCS